MMERSFKILIFGIILFCFVSDSGRCYKWVSKSKHAYSFYLVISVVNGGIVKNNFQFSNNHSKNILFDITWIYLCIFYFQIRRLGNGSVTSLVDQISSDVITTVAPGCISDVTEITTATIGQMNPIVVNVRVTSNFLKGISFIVLWCHECVGHGTFLYKRKEAN